MKNRNIYTGDIVSLKSGGPKMTVVGIRCMAGETEIRCSWIKKDGTPVTHDFVESALIRDVS